MSLTEKQWVQLAYDRQKIDLEKLDSEYYTNSVVYQAKRKLILEIFDHISNRLDEIDAEEKRNE